MLQRTFVRVWPILWAEDGFSEEGASEANPQWSVMFLRLFSFGFGCLRCGLLVHCQPHSSLDLDAVWLPSHNFAALLVALDRGSSSPETYNPETSSLLAMPPLSAPHYASALWPIIKNQISAASPTPFLNSSRKGMLYILKLAFSSLKCSLCKISSSVVLTLCDPTGYSPPGSSVHGILQARILEWVVISSSGGSSPPRDQTYVSQVPCIGQVGSLSLAPPVKPWNVLKGSFKKYNDQI